MSRLHAAILRFAPTTANVVVYGESGTGKELVVRALHALSSRANGPFVAANVAAIPATLLLSELFGHERGAFTGAVTRRRGLFEEAHGGTLFLDEVGELPLEAQTMLLRVLETREVRPVGSERVRRVDVRLVVATHRNLSALVGRRRFREDLFHRLYTLILRTPALRHHITDLPAIATHLLSRMRSEVGERQMSPTALVSLQHYGWPGNVRQLANVIRRACALSDHELVDQQTILRAFRDEPHARGTTVDGINIASVTEIYAREGGSIAATARTLGLARSTVRARLRRSGIPPRPS